MSFSTLYPRPGHGASTSADWGAKKSIEKFQPLATLVPPLRDLTGEGEKADIFHAVLSGENAVNSGLKSWFWGFFYYNKRLNFSVSPYHQRH